MEIEIKTEALKNDAKQMSEALSRLKGDIGNMNEAVASLNGMWQGRSHDAFVNQYLSDYDKMSELCKTVDKLIGCLNFAVEQYDFCDDSVRNLVKTIKI